MPKICFMKPRAPFLGDNTMVPAHRPETLEEETALRRFIVGCVLRTKVYVGRALPADCFSKLETQSS